MGLAEGSNLISAYAKVSLEKLRPHYPSQSMYVANHQNAWAQPLTNDLAFASPGQVSKQIKQFQASKIIF